MENQILDDNDFGNKKEESMRNNIDRANYAIYAYSVVLISSFVLLLSNIYSVFIEKGSTLVASNFTFINSIFTILYGFGVLIGFILFLMWFRRAYKNIQIIGYETRHTDGWAVGGFFVPIIGLYYPYNIMTEIWQKMKLTAEGNDIKHYLKGGIHGWWWFFWLVSFFMSYVSFSAGVKVNFSTASSEPTFSTVFENVANCLDALFTILVVKSLRDTEKELRKEGEF